MTNDSHPRWIDWLGGIRLGLMLALWSHEAWIALGWPCS